MASLPERIAAQREDVLVWRQREEDQIHEVWHRRRLYAQNHHSPEKHALKDAEAVLAHDRKMLDAAEDKLDRLRAEYAKNDKLERSVDYWRDRVQDLHREVQRLAKLVHDERVSFGAERELAKGELELMAEIAAQVRDGEILPPEEDEDHPEPVEEIVFTRRRTLTATEQRLTYVRNLWHHAKLMLARARKALEEELRGGDRSTVVRAAVECMDHSGSYHYSMGGAWTMKYFPGGEPWGDRSDCSQWFTKCYHRAGAPDPNGQGYVSGYTGTLGAHGDRVSSPRPGDAVLVGSPPDYHHVEMYVGTGQGCSDEVQRMLKNHGADGQSTIGHGDRNVNFGSLPWYAPRTYRSYF